MLPPWNLVHGGCQIPYAIQDPCLRVRVRVPVPVRRVRVVVGLWSLGGFAILNCMQIPSARLHSRMLALGEGIEAGPLAAGHAIVQREVKLFAHSRPGDVR